MSNPDHVAHAPRSGRVLVSLGAIAAVLVLILTALGVWQLQRLCWKLDLIQRTEAMLAADPVPAPDPESWDRITRADEYRRLRVAGRYLHGRDTLVQAVTDLGPGFWVMTPLRTDAGWTLLVNRGFVPADRRAPDDRSLPEGPQQVTGLLRPSQPGGAFLRRNDPADGRWYSRDTAAIAAAQGLGPVAPYFLDRAGVPDPDDLPIPGLTVVGFRNSHLTYALTWFTMAIGLAVAVVVIGRREWRLRRALR